MSPPHLVCRTCPSNNKTTLILSLSSALKFLNFETVSAALLHNDLDGDDQADPHMAKAQLAGTRIILPTARLFLQPTKWPPDSNIIIATTILIIFVIEVIH